MIFPFLGFPRRPAGWKAGRAEIDAKMRIAIDTRPLQTASRYRGIGSYITSLVRQLVRIAPDNEYVFLTRGGPEPPGLDLPAQCRHRYLPVPAGPGPAHLNWIWDKFTLPSRLAHEKIDLFHHTSPFEFITGYDPRRRAPFATVTTVYDLNPLYAPSETFHGRRALLRPFYNYLVRSLSGSGLSLAISRFTALDLEQSLGISPERIRVTLLAADAACHPPTPEEKERVSRHYGLDRPFLFYLGGFNPNKNLRGLARALARVLQDHPTCLLVVAGKRSPQVKRETDNIVWQEGVPDAVRFLEFVPTQDLAGLYGLCRAFVFPSFREGFGLPPLEALACGAPVACSRASSLPEVTGEAALYFEPYRIEDMAAVIMQLWTDPKLRERLSAAGPAQAAGFSWERCARETLAAYRQALESTPARAGQSAGAAPPAIESP